MSSIRVVCGAAALAVAVVGCGGDSTAPKPAIVVTLTADSPTPDPVITDTPNGPRITCNVNLTATATGNGTAAWGDATTYWYIGADRTTPVDTSTNPSDDVVQGFLGHGGISGGDTLHTTWYFYNGAPFEASIGFAYTTDKGKTSIAWTHFRCGPDAATAVTPTVNQITLPSTSGEIKPGDTVSVSYQEASSSGVWVSIIDASGSFLSSQIVGEHLATTVDRTVKFVVPGQLHPGVPLTISVRAYDAALVGRFKSLETQLKFVDRTPPVLSQPWNPSGQFAAGDTLSFSASATDDNLLGWLIYQIGPPATLIDSIPAAAGRAFETFDASVVVRPEWAGQPVTLSVTARDAGGLTSQTLSSQPGSLRFYPEVDRTTSAPLSLSASSSADDIAYDARRDVMYVGIPGDNRVAVFSVGTMTLQSPIVLPGAPSGMDLSLSGDSLLVAVPSANAIEVIDLVHPTATPGTIRLSVLDTAAPAAAGMAMAPSGLRIAANGKMFVFLTYPTTSNDQVVEVDLTSKAQRIRTDARNLATVYPFWTTYMGRTADRSKIFILGPCGARYDAATDSFALCRFGSQASLMGVTTDATGDHVTRGVAVFNGDLTTSEEVGYVYNRPRNVAISPDGATIYIADNKNLRTMRLADLTMLERIPIPLSSDRLFVSPDGKWVLAFQVTNGAKVTRVDLQ